MTLSKERLEQYIRQPLENGLTRGEVMQLAKMMINQDDWNAAQQRVIDDLRVQLERRERDKQDPVRYMNRFTGACYTLDQQPDAATDTAVYVPLYAEQPAPVVTKECPAAIRDLMASHSDGLFDDADAQQIWLACRAAMLQSFGNSEQLNSPVVPVCWCRTCRPVSMANMRFVVCPECGNKRCPKANDHRNSCSGSNEPGQEGSAYPAAPKQESE